MWDLSTAISLIRYLFVWRVNSSLVWLPQCLSTELSRVLGATIAKRLPTHAARPWEKALAPWDDYRADVGRSGKGEKHKPIPEISWPLQAVLFVYPGKLAYGRGELILWELKLLGASADHELFLELILPAVEDASRASDAPGYGRNQLWGHFDVDSVYAARGAQWEPFVRAGRLDLRYRARPDQWRADLDFGGDASGAFDTLTWITPFDLAGTPPLPGALAGRWGGGRQARATPTLQDIAAALVARAGLALPGKPNTPEAVLDILSAQEQAALQQALQQAAEVRFRSKKIQRATRYWPGRWIGAQTFSSIPPAMLPYLELASILHVGKQTHFGCGTFVVS